MNTYIITEKNNGVDEFINASTNKDMIIKQLLILSGDLKIQVLTDNNELKDFREYMENKLNRVITPEELSLRELSIEELAKRITKLYDYIETITQGSAPHVKARINEILYGKSNIQ